MEDLLTCSVCCEQYQEKQRHPVLLPRCGHSFCRPCIAFLVKNGCVICPTCRMDQRVETADHLPTEFSLLAITNAQQVTKMEMCQRHDVKLSFWCKSCGVPACGECLFEDHPTHAHRIIKSSTYITEMKDAVSDIANKFVDALDLRERWYHQEVFRHVRTINDAIRTLSVMRRDIEDARELVKGVNVVEGIGPTTALSDASKCLGLKWNLKDCQLELRHSGGHSGGREEAAVVEKKPEEEKTPGQEKEGTGMTEEPAESKEKMDDEKSNATEEKEMDELENLTEEEKRKRRKMQRIRDKLAAAAAAAEKSEAGNKDKLDNRKQKTENKGKEKSERDKDGKEKDNEAESSKSLAVAKTQRLARKYAPVSREPSSSPARDPPPDTDPDKDTDASAKPEGGVEVEKDTRTDSKTDSPSASTKQRDEEPSKASEPACPTEASVRKEPWPKSKTGTTESGVKRTRGRLARQALKRSQTTNFTPEDRAAADSTKDDQSDDIKGLDLETTKATRGSDVAPDNRETEAQATKEEATEETRPVKEEKEEKKENQENEKNTKDKFFEMEPEEKERITTELLQVPSLTVIVEGIGGRLSYVTWEPMGLHVYCHQYQELPYDVIIKSTVLLSLVPTKAPMVFLDVGSEQKLLGRVYISLWGHLRRAANFLHLCLGDRGPSYRNTMFLEVLNADCPGERIKGGDYEYNNGRGGETILDDLESQEGYSMPMEAGMVTAGGPNRKEVDSQFFICTEDDFDRKFACPFGRVVSGLHVMKEAVWLVVTKEMWIRDCGVVLDVPRMW